MFSSESLDFHVHAGGQIELHLAAQEAVGGKAAEDEIGVGHGRVRAALAVTDGPRFGAGTFRADAKRSAVRR